MSENQGDQGLTNLEKAKAQIAEAKKSAEENAVTTSPANDLPQNAAAVASDSTAENKNASNTANTLSTKESFNQIFQKVETKTGVKKNHQIAIGGGIIALIIIIIIALCFTIFSGYMVSGDVKEIGAYPTKTNKDIDSGEAKASHSFAKDQNISIKFDIEPKSQTDTVNYTYRVLETSKKVEDTGEATVVRKGSLPVQGDQENTRVSRYISIVSSAKTQLEPGDYEFELSDNTGIVGKYSFKVTNETSAQ